MCQGASASAPCLEPRVSNGAKAGLYSRTRSCIASGSYISHRSTLQPHGLRVLRLVLSATRVWTGHACTPPLPISGRFWTTTSPPSMLTLRSTHRPSHCLGCCPSHFTCYPASFKLLDSLYHLHPRPYTLYNLHPALHTPTSPALHLLQAFHSTPCLDTRFATPPAPYTSHSTLQCATSFFIQHSQLRSPHATPQTLPNYSAQTPHPTT